MNQAAEIRSVIAQLEKIALSLGGAAPAQGTGIQEVLQLKAFKDQLHVFEEASTHVTIPALKDITPIVVKIFHLMEVVVQFSSQTKKTTADQNKQIQKLITDNINKIAKLQTADIQSHCKAIIEGSSASFWVLGDTPVMQVDSALEAAEYNGLKVKQAKVVENSKWYDAFISSIKILKEFIVNNHKLGLDWNPKGTHTFEDLLAALKDEKPAAAAKPAGPPKLPPPPPPAHKLEPVTATEGGNLKDALFAELNVGEDITKRLRKVDKKQIEQDKLNSEPLKATVPKQQVVHQAAANKPPRRYQKENWFLENFVNERLIEFTDEEIDMKQSLFIENCVGCGIIVKAKVKSIFLQGCQKIQLVFEQTVLGVDIVGCKRIEVQCLNVCPSLQINNSESVHMTFSQNKHCEIISSKTMDLNLSYIQEDGELAKDTNIPEQFVTVFDHEQNKFITKPLDSQFG